MTVGSGFAPDLLTPPILPAGARGLVKGVSALAHTAGGEFRPALKTH
jgi:hypothetical protein